MSNDQDPMQLLYSLTPGGSEFHDDPARCAQWIREQLATRAHIAGQRNQMRNTLQDITAALENVMAHFQGQMTPFDRHSRRNLIGDAHLLLERKDPAPTADGPLTTFTGTVSTWRIYREPDGRIRAEVEFTGVEAEGSVLLGERGYGLGFGVQGYNEDRDIGMIDLFNVANPSFDNNLTADRPAVIIDDPGGDPLVSVTLHPDGAYARLTNGVEEGVVCGQRVWGYFDHV